MANFLAVKDGLKAVKLAKLNYATLGPLRFDLDMILKIPVISVLI